MTGWVLRTQWKLNQEIGAGWKCTEPLLAAPDWECSTILGLKLEQQMYWQGHGSIRGTDGNMLLMSYTGHTLACLVICSIDHWSSTSSPAASVLPCSMNSVHTFGFALSLVPLTRILATQSFDLRTWWIDVLMKLLYAHCGLDWSSRLPPNTLIPSPPPSSSLPCHSSASPLSLL